MNVKLSNRTELKLALFFDGPKNLEIYAEPPLIAENFSKISVI